MYENNGHIHPFPLGRIVQHDERSRGFALPESDLATLQSVRWKRYAPVFNQGNLGSCTGNAALGLIGTAPFYDSLIATNRLPILQEETAVDIYSRATVIDEWPGQYPPEDTGSSGLAVAKVMKDQGWISAYFHAFSFNAALTALQQGPVMTGVNWYNSFFYPTSSGQCMLTPDSFSAGGHEICMDQIDVENRRVWFTNSWGSGWGLDGRAWFSFDTWERLLAESGDVTQAMPIIETDPIPNPNPDADGCLAKILGPWALKVSGQRWRSKKDKEVAIMALNWIDAKKLAF